jgi:hypothetical protein
VAVDLAISEFTHLEWDMLAKEARVCVSAIDLRFKTIQLTAIACFWCGLLLLRRRGGGPEVAKEVFRPLDQTQTLKREKICFS